MPILLGLGLGAGGTAPRTESAQDDLDSQDGDLLTPESSMGMDGSQQQASDEVTLVMKLVPEEALPQEQLQHILGPYL